MEERLSTSALSVLFAFASETRTVKQGCAAAAASSAPPFLPRRVVRRRRRHRRVLLVAQQRAAQHLGAVLLARLLLLEREANFNVAPTTDVAVVVERDGRRGLALRRWGS